MNPQLLKTTVRVAQETEQEEKKIMQKIGRKAGVKRRKKEDSQRKQNRERAREIITRRVEYFAPQVGVTYNRIFIKEQKTRWGSCSSLGNLNFNWKLILLDTELLDYVVVHELAHRKQMNHSAAFWSEVEKVLPDYRERRRRLREWRG